LAVVGCGGYTKIFTGLAVMVMSPELELHDMAATAIMIPKRYTVNFLVIISTELLYSVIELCTKKRDELLFVVIITK
jgi:hypothetical protein